MELPPRALAWVLGVELGRRGGGGRHPRRTARPRPRRASRRCSPCCRWRTPSSPPASNAIAAGSRRPPTSTSARCGRSRRRCCCPRRSPRPSCVVVYAHLWHRVWRPAGVPLHRHLYTTATVVLAATAAHEVVTGAGGMPADPSDLAGALGIIAAMLAYVVVNTLLIAVAIGLSRHTTARPASCGPLGRQRARDRHAVPRRARGRGARRCPVPRGARAAADPRAAPRGAGSPPGGGREPRREDGAAQRGHLAGARRPGGRRRAPGGRRGGCAHRRPRPLQGGQRRPRPPRGRRRARRRRQGPPRGGAQPGPRRPVRRARSSWCWSGRCPRASPGGSSSPPSRSDCAGGRPARRARTGRRRDRRPLGVGGRGVRRVDPAARGPRRGVRAADACLYAAKRDGRDRVRIAGTPRTTSRCPRPAPRETPCAEPRAEPTRSVSWSA